MTLLKHDRMKKAAGNTWHFFVLDSCEKGSYTSTISVDGVESVKQNLLTGEKTFWTFSTPPIIFQDCLS